MFTNFTRVQQLFDQAVEIEPGRRAEWAREACQGDAALLERLLELLSSAEQDSILRNKVASTGVPENIGAYRILREIGRGGMGVVYLATRNDGTFRRNVALKALSRERVSPEFVLRFRQERQVMAALDHPNIARILDGGDTADEVPWYAMEFVEGAPIDQYCDEQQLSLTGRIRIFQQVCRAVDYLHQNSIVHRDLKPSNILVTTDGAAKLLDFGIARFTGAAGASSYELTSIQGRPMTPIYASPEQIAGATLKKSSDIYSLGVVLYKLLTGRAPWEGFDDKVAKLAAREEPPAPSANIREDLRNRAENTTQLRRTLAGEIDSIVLMAMRHDPNRRYASAAALAEDLDRFLDGHTVVAHHDSVAVRSFKLLKRKRVAAAVVAGFLAIGGFGLWELDRVVTVGNAAATREANLRAVIAGLEKRLGATPMAQRIEDVRKLRKAFSADFPAAAAKQPGHSPELDALLERGIRYLDGIRQAGTPDPDLLSEITGAYEELGMLEEKSPYANSSNRQAALKTYLKSANLLASVEETRGTDSTGRERLATLNRRIQDLGGTPVIIVTRAARVVVSSAVATPRKGQPIAGNDNPSASSVEVDSAEPPSQAPQPAPVAKALQPKTVSGAVRDDFDRTRLQVNKVEASFEEFKQALASRNEVPNEELAGSLKRMADSLERAKQSLDAGDEDTVTQQLETAREMAARIQRRTRP